jgi:uncharacterized membrane protein YedE/YeeE
MDMRRHRVKVLLIGGVLVAVAGCATGAEWGTWKQHPTHFASGDHMSFSVRNREAAAPRVNRQDIVMARDEGWWGKPITVSQEQILER